MQHELVDFSVERFEHHFGLEGLRGDVSFAIHSETLVTVYVPGIPPPAMVELANMIELEYDELGMTARVCLKSSDTWRSQLKTRLTRWAASAAAA